MPRGRAYPLGIAVVAALIVILGTGTALAAWLVTAPGSLASAQAATLPAGNRPDVTASVTTVTVSWAGSTVAGHPVDGYQLTRYDSSGHPASPQNGCGGRVSATSCTETTVPDGTWTYTVRAVEGAHWTGAEGPASAPVAVATSGVTFPVAGQSYGIDSYTAGCSTKSAGDICGTAAAGAGATLTGVSVSVRQGTGKYWNPSDNRFSSDAEQLFPLGKAAAWKLPFPVSTFPASGPYTVRAVVTDSAGRTSSASATFTVYPQAPPVPSIVSGPGDPTNQTAARFTFSDSQAGVTFACSLDSATFTGCTSPTDVPGPLTKGAHRFRVEGVDPGGNVSAVVTYTWTVDTTAPHATDVQAGNGSGGTAGRIETGDTLTLSYSEPLAPGSVLSGWDGQAPANVVLHLDPNTVTVYATDGHPLTAIGPVDLGRSGYLLHATTATATLSVSGSDLVLTIGTVADPTAVGAVIAAGTMTWTPGGGTDPAGNPLAGAGQPVTEKHPGGTDVEF
jgi:hypothetical protein